MSNAIVYSAQKKYAVHFGGGNIGRGFIGNLLYQSGFDIIFVDVQQDLINAINRKKQYEVKILEGSSVNESEYVSNVQGILGTSEYQQDINEAILHADIISTAVGVSILGKIAPIIAKALEYRFNNNGTAINLIACENKIGASKILQAEIEKHLQDKLLLKGKVGYPNCGVDRIVVTNPKYTGEDELTVCVEKYREWSIDANDYIGEKTITTAHFTNELDAYADRKLFTLNTGHAISAYLGYLRHLSTIYESLSDAEIHTVVRNAMIESGNALVKKWGLNEQETLEYIDTAIKRISNELLEDEVIRVGREVMRKLSKKDRLVYPLNLCATYNLPRTNIIKGIVAALHFDYEGDNEASVLQTLIKEQGVAHVLVEICGVKNQEDVQKIVDEYNKGTP